MQAAGSFQASVLIVLAILAAVSSADCQDYDQIVWWKSDLMKIENLLAEGRFRKALKKSENLTETMLDTLVSGSAVPKTLGITTAYRAIALAGLGDTHEALWYWCIASQFSPSIEQLDLGYLGLDPIAFRAQITAYRSEVASPGWSEADPPTNPDIRMRSGPQLPKAKASMQQTAEIAVRIVIQTDGSIRDPKIVSSSGEPTLVFSLLEAVKRWKYEPSQFHGEAIEMPCVIRTQINP